MTDQNRWIGVLGRSWEWADRMSTSGVHTSEGRLVWWSRPAGPGGHFGEVATEQAFESFLEFGPPVFVPEAVAQELRGLLVAKR